MNNNFLRPTWTPAVAGSGDRGQWSTGGVTMQFSARDLTSHTKLKFRQVGQNSEAELRRKDVKRALEEAEQREKEVFMIRFITVFLSCYYPPPASVMYSFPSCTAETPI